MHTDRELSSYMFFFFQAEDGIRDYKVTGVQTCALPISGGTAGCAALAAPCAGATGASQPVPAGYRKLKPHFQRAPHCAPPSRALISCRRISTRGLEARNAARAGRDRKSTRLNSSHLVISYAVF